MVFDPPDGVVERDRRKSDYNRRARQHETEALQGMDDYDWVDPDGVSLEDHASQDDP